MWVMLFEFLNVVPEVLEFVDGVDVVDDQLRSLGELDFLWI